MSRNPWKPFIDAVTGTASTKSKLKSPLELNPPRDKDNTDRQPKAPTGRSAPNLAPRGAMGTKRSLSPARPKQPKKSFKLGVGGELKREFKPIAPPSTKDRGRER